MRGEKTAQVSTRQRVDDVEVRKRRVQGQGRGRSRCRRLRRTVIPPTEASEDAALLGGSFEPLERLGQTLRIAGQRRAGRIGAVLAATRHGQLDDQRRDRGEDDRDERSETAALSVVAAAEDHLELGHLSDEADGPTDRGCDRSDERVAILDVRQLMGEDAGQLAIVHEIEDPGRHGDRGVLRVPACREGVRLRPIDDVEAGHRQPGPRGERADNRSETGQLARLELAGAVGTQRERVALPVDEAVHRDGEEQGDDHPAAAAEQATNEDEEATEGGQQGEGLDGIS